MPPARMPTLSADASLNARRVTCHQPRGGIWVGSSAWSPGRSVPEGEEGEPGAGEPEGPEWAGTGSAPRATSAARPFVSGATARGARARYGSVRVRRAADAPFSLRSAANPATPQASAFAPGTVRGAGSVGEDGDVGGRDTGLLRRIGQDGHDCYGG